MENSKKGNLPLHHGIKISKDLCPKTDEELDRMSRVPYASVVGSIMYAMTCTRSDVSFALSMVSQHQENHVVIGQLVTGYCDAIWQTDKDDCHSQSGWVFLLNRGAVTWKSSKQDIVADSTCESEYIAACEASKEAIWMKNFIGDLGVVPTVQDPIEIFCDNKSVVALIKEPKDHGKGDSDIIRLSQRDRVTASSPFRCELLKMSTENGVNPPAPNPSHNSHFSSLSDLGRERLTGPNYMDWMQNLRLESLNMVFDAELSINIILSDKQRIKKIDVPSTSVALVLTVGHNAKKRKTSHSKWKGKAVKGKSNRGSKRKAEYDIAPTSDPKEAVCFYCNTKWHWKCSCLKYLKDLKDGKVKKGSHSGLFMIELHNTTTLDSWVLDTGCGTHICTILQGLKESRRLKHGELNLVMGNRKITHATRIGKYELMLKSGVRIDLNNYCYSLEMARNIISFHDLFKDGFKLSFDNENGDILVYSNGCFMFKASPCKGIYETVECISHNVILNVGKRPSLGHIKIWGCEDYIRREARDKIEAISEKCLFFGYPKESFGYLFYKPKDNVVFIARRGVFLEREMISKKDSKSKIDLEEIQESVNEEPIVNTNTQQEVVTPVKPDDISLSIRRTSG
ncbi:hypothetical protein Tco_0459477 [Tanacetum coccineum]